MRRFLLPVLLFAPALSAAAPSMAETGPPNLSGTWRMSCMAKRGAREITLQIRQDGAKLSGSFAAGGRTGAIDGAVQGSQVSINVGAFGFTGTAAGDTLDGHGRRGVACSAKR